MRQGAVGNQTAVQQEALIHETESELPGLLDERGEKIETLLDGSLRGRMVHGVHHADLEDGLKCLPERQALNLKWILVTRCGRSALIRDGHGQSQAALQPLDGYYTIDWATVNEQNAFTELTPRADSCCAQASLNGSTLIRASPYSLVSTGDWAPPCANGIPPRPEYPLSPRTRKSALCAACLFGGSQQALQVWQPAAHELDLLGREQVGF